MLSTIKGCLKNAVNYYCITRAINIFNKEIFQPDFRNITSHGIPRNVLTLPVLWSDSENKEVNLKLFSSEQFPIALGIPIEAPLNEADPNYVLYLENLRNRLSICETFPIYLRKNLRCAIIPNGGKLLAIYCFENYLSSLYLIEIILGYALNDHYGYKIMKGDKFSISKIHFDLKVIIDEIKHFLRQQKYYSPNHSLTELCIWSLVANASINKKGLSEVQYLELLKNNVPAEFAEMIGKKRII